MSRGPKIYEASYTVRMTPEQKEEICRASTKIGSQLSIFTRDTLVKAASKINKAA